MAVLWLIVGAVIGASGAWSITSARARHRSAPNHEVVGDEVGESQLAPHDSPEPDAERMTRALDALRLGVVISNADGEVVLRNAPATFGTGALHADVLVDEAVDAMLGLARRGESGRRVLELFGPPARVVVVRAEALGDGSAVATIEDVTERSRLDAVRTDFVANVSHELKTPVGAIAILAEALVDETDLEVVRRFASKMVAESHRVGRTIDDLLELSRIELGGEMIRQPVDLSRVIAEAVDRVDAMAAQRGITIEKDGSEPATVEGDVRQLVSAVGNLVENAVKYSDDGAIVRVATTCSEGEVTVTVTDVGVGIPARDLDRVFERFYRVDRARSRDTGGTGLGLAIVRHVATNHGGTVTVTSREGEGSCFTLVLPTEAGGGG